MRNFTTKGVLGLALLVLAVTFTSTATQSVPLPGAITINTNLKYLNNMLGLIFPITVQEVLQQKQFNLTFEDKGFAYKIDIKDVFVNSVNVATSFIGYIPGTNTVRILVSGFDISTRVDGSITALWFIPLKTAGLNVTNMTLQVDLNAPTTDNVNWQVKDAIIVDVTDFQFELQSSFFQGIVNMLHGSILKAVKGELPKVKDLIQAKIDLFNNQMSIHNSTAFLVSLFDSRFPLNLTFTEAPQTDNADNILELHLDGTFYDSIDKTSHVKQNQVFPKRIDGLNSHQIFVHQTMLQSLFFALDQDFFPYKVSNTGITSQLTNMFYEIQNYYGADMISDLEVSILADDGDFLVLNKNTGIEIGKHNNASLHLMVYCQNKTTERELAVQFAMNFNAVLNISEENYYVYVNIPQIQVSNVEVLNDRVGMNSRDYNMLLSIFIMTAQQMINDMFRTPYDFRSLDPKLMFFITSVFSKPRISPFYLDNFLYLGLTYQFDFMPMTHSEKKFVQDTLLAQHGDKIAKVCNLAIDTIQKAMLA